VESSFVISPSPGMGRVAVSLNSPSPAGEQHHPEPGFVSHHLGVRRGRALQRHGLNLSSSSLSAP
jgi:hypothetical protein